MLVPALCERSEDMTGAAIASAIQLAIEGTFCSLDNAVFIVLADEGEVPHPDPEYEASKMSQRC